MNIRLPDVAELVALIRAMRDGGAELIWLDGLRTGVIAALALAALVFSLTRPR